MAKSYQPVIHCHYVDMLCRLFAGAAGRITCKAGTVTADTPGISEEHRSIFAESEASVPKVDPQQLNAGQHIHILTGGVPLTDFPEFIALPTEVVGTVKVVDSDRLVLQDVVMINEARSHSGVPILSKVPFTSRLFKNTSVGRSSTAVPGEVTLDLSKILHASELTEGEFAAMQKRGRPERIGVDFNVDVADGGDVTR